MSESLFSLFRTQERFTLYERAIRSFQEQENWNLDFNIFFNTFWLCFYKKQNRANRSFKRCERAICSLKKNTSNSHEKPKRKFPTLILILKLFPDPDPTYSLKYVNIRVNYIKKTVNLNRNWHLTKSKFKLLVQGTSFTDILLRNYCKSINAFEKLYAKELSPPGKKLRQFSMSQTMGKNKTLSMLCVRHRESII